MSGSSHVAASFVISPYHSRFISSGGQSGNALSPQYAAFLADWQAGRYRPMRFERATIDAEQASTLRFEP